MKEVTSLPKYCQLIIIFFSVLSYLYTVSYECPVVGRSTAYHQSCHLLQQIYRFQSHFTRRLKTESLRILSILKKKSYRAESFEYG